MGKWRYERATAHRWPTAFVVLAALVASLVIGGLESWAQTILPDALAPLANSSSGWVIITVILVYASRARPLLAAPLAIATMVLLLCGYALVSTWRGYFYDPTLWILISIVVGPFVGVATAWLHEKGVRVALGAGALAGIGCGEAAYGLLRVAGTTGYTYWIGLAIVSVAFIVFMLLTKVKGLRPAAIMIAVCAVAGTALYLIYTLL